MAPTSDPYLGPPRGLNLHARTQILPWRGKGRCTWCGITPLPGRRTAWCSDSCKSEGYLRMSSSHVRTLVERRDRGVCSGCGFDAGLAERILTRLKYAARATREQIRVADAAQWTTWLNTVWRKSSWIPGRDAIERFAEHYQPAVSAQLVDIDQTQQLLWHVWTERTKMTTSLWEADHVLPVAEGGGACGLDGFRTLCMICHRKETAALAKRRAAARRTTAWASKRSG